MLEKFLGYTSEKELFQPSDHILLAVSGGIDSVVMSHLFYKAKLNFAIAHCNFGLRGAESDEDELFVKKLAKKYKVPFYSDTFETEAFAQQEKISIQMAARTLRYRWFEQLLNNHGFQYLATAHHLNDILETVLFNLTKGTGISGLHGIQPKLNRIIRPLLFADKEQIYAYVVEHQLAWREDSSNQSSKYQRNLIRNEVIPLLKTINPNLEETIQHTIEKVVSVERIFEEDMHQLKSRLVQQKTDIMYIDFIALQQEFEPVIKLSYLLKEYQFSFTQTKDIWQSLGAESGRRFESPTHTLVKDRTSLIITPKALNEFISTSIEKEQLSFQNEFIHLHFETMDAKDFTITPNSQVACLDLATLQFPLKLRRWKEGDWFCPLGMNKKKKISDFLIDTKVPVNLKSRIWVLTSNGSIVWIVGHRIDNRFKITDKTEQVLQISLA
ncbi:tRNA lysidine(34) synthetase TilS [Rhodocytophaga rosea]|uniref:tRNA(Ile)-lysidine synthase n=1 Tax=Rhodocytophaga rosea TaxID=2704465 RepID=A0A6C0GHS2_9BACT|nr:tRNA lysidine(34) synthetase TilS [Rhodocytophaga rosea]QHT67497.1 tRNA lysidine(34) synthetase TilS [Rhodocytophaga rosea]